MSYRANRTGLRKLFSLGKSEGRSHSRRRLYFSGMLFIAVTLSTTGAAIWELRRDRIAADMLATDNLAVVLAAQTARSFQAIDLVLKETRSMVAASGVADREQFAERMAGHGIHQFLVERLHSLPQADALSLIDETGRIVNFSRSWPAPAIDTSDRDFYAYWREHDDTGVFIGAPVVNKVTGAWVLTVTRRIDGPGGRFLGVVLGVVEMRYFEEFYRSLQTSEGEAMSLFRLDGTLIARDPRVDSLIGVRLAAGSPWYSVIANGGGTYRAPGNVSGIPRIVSTQPVREYPLAVSVAVSEQVALAPWRRQSVMIGLGALGAMLGFGVLFTALAAQFRDLEFGEARFRGFATTSSDWFWETDEQHRISYLSEEISTGGIKPSDLMGRTRWEIAGEAADETDQWKEHCELLARHAPFRDFRYARPTPDGLGTASISGDPRFDDSGRFLGYRGTGRDITHQIRAEHSLREAKDAAEAASLAKSQFLANMSHELRTPLNAINGFSEALELGIVGPLQPRQKEYIELIRQSGEHLLNVINDILDLAKVDAGKFELHEESEIDPRRIVGSCVALVKSQAVAGAVRLSVEMAKNLPLVTVDSTRFKQILLNLLSNAIKFTDRGGSVVIAAFSTDESGFAFEVRDTGPGLTPQEVEIALQPFSQVESSYTRRHQGTGLGLPLARRLTELHGGTLRIESAKGRGTTVTVTLPASRVAPGATRTALQLQRIP